MYKVSCFADEISPDLQEQIAVVKRNNIEYICLRSVWDKNVLDLNDDELDHVKRQLDKSDLKVSSIGSPIGKISIKDNFEGHMERFERAIKAALKMEAKYLRIFSFYMNREETDLYKSEVMERLGRMVRIAEKEDIILLHENEAGIFGETCENCLKLFKTIRNPHFKAAFDPSNFVVAGEDVIHTSFPMLKEHIAYMHIKDSKRGSGEIVPVGMGDGHITEILEALRERSFLFLTLEPHLAQAGSFRGFSGPELFEKAHQALLNILNRLSIPIM